MQVALIRGTLSCQCSLLFVLGACCRLMSGMRAWAKFADGVLGANGDHIPPTVEGLLAFSEMFRSVGTFKNYVGAISYACDLANVPGDACRDRLLKRAKDAIRERGTGCRERRFIQRPLLRKLVLLASEEGDRVEAALYVLCYAFMLRSPSETGQLAFVNGHLGQTSHAHSQNVPMISR